MRQLEKDRQFAFDEGYAKSLRDRPHSRLRVPKLPVPEHGHQVKRSRVLEVAGGSASEDLEPPRTKSARPETDYKKVQITAAGQSG